jgi:RNA 2',3'-cyclic 3'-phosphodiesterase
MEERWRCFVAVPLGERLRGELAQAVAELRARMPVLEEQLRWTDPAGWHLTLAFLGWVSPDSVEGVAGVVRDVATRHAPFTVTTGGLGGFPSRRQVRVLWYGLAGRSETLAALARETRAALGHEDESPFRAHLTLARSRARHERGVTVPEVVWKSSMPSGEIAVGRLILYRSHLGRGPAHYEALAEARIGSLLEVAS